MTYEGYGPGGAAVMVQVATDNKNRTVSEIRHIFGKFGGNMGEVGSVGWMFERKSQILVDLEQGDEDKMMNLVLEIGADDLQNDGANWQILSAPEAHHLVMDALEKAKVPTEAASIAMIPKNLTKLESKHAGSMLRLAEKLEEHDDVQNVFSNFDIDESDMEELAG